MKTKHHFLKLTAFLLAVAVCYCGCVFFLSGRSGLNFVAIAEEGADKTTGTLNYSDGTSYEGEILYGRIRQGTGTFTWSTGEKYTGAWENDSPSGKGTLEWPGLGVYNGEFFNGKRDGIGTFTWTYEGDIPEGAPLSYEGAWAGDKIQGEGKMVFSGIGTYEGSFANQQRSGEGTCTWQNGDV